MQEQKLWRRQLSVVPALKVATYWAAETFTFPDVGPRPETVYTRNNYNSGRGREGLRHQLTDHHLDHSRLLLLIKFFSLLIKELLLFTTEFRSNKQLKEILSQAKWSYISTPTLIPPSSYTSKGYNFRYYFHFRCSSLKATDVKAERGSLDRPELSMDRNSTRRVARYRTREDDNKLL